MKINSLRVVHKRKFKQTIGSNYKYPGTPNLLQRNFTINQPNRIGVTDITYIWMLQGWLYLAFVLDLYSRPVVGLAMADRITDELTQSALKQVFLRHRSRRV